jgi:hypothetical protein
MPFRPDKLNSLKWAGSLSGPFVGGNVNRKVMTKEQLCQIGKRKDCIQVVPTQDQVRPFLIHPNDDPAMANRPLDSPTGPGGAAGFSNRSGSQIPVPEAWNIYLGPFWDDQSFVEGFSKAIVENGYLDPLKTLGYGTGPGTYLGMLNGPTLRSGSTFADSDAQSTIKKLADSGQINPNQNSLYFLILPDGVTSTIQGASSCSDYCGYHDAFDYKGVSIAYAVLPAATCQGCGGLIADFTAVYAHELAEAVTDKVPGQGWVADDGEENGDLEAWVLFGWGPPDNPKLYTIQGYYTNEQGDTVGAWRDASTGGGGMGI